LWIFVLWLLLTMSASQSSGTLLVWVGVCLLVHAGFSAVHYKEFAAIGGVEIDSDFIPIDVKLEVMVGVIVSILGAVLSAGEFQPVDGSAILNKV